MMLRQKNSNNNDDGDEDDDDDDDDDDDNDDDDEDDNNDHDDDCEDDDDDDDGEEKEKDDSDDHDDDGEDDDDDDDDDNDDDNDDGDDDDDDGWMVMVMVMVMVMMMVMMMMTTMMMMLMMRMRMRMRMRRRRRRRRRVRVRIVMIDPEPGTFLRACAVETHVKISQVPLGTENYRKNAAAQIEPRTQTHILREPALQKRMSTLHKRHQQSHFIIQKFTRKMPPPRLSPGRRHTLVRPCAVEMHFNISQEASEEPLYTEIYTKNAAAQIELGTQTHILREPAQLKRMSTFHKRHQKSHLYGCLQQKYRSPD